jgi:hypothetical protein
MPLGKGAAGVSLQVPLNCFCEQFIWQRDIRHQIPRFEFVCVNGFARIVLREARAQTALLILIFHGRIARADGIDILEKRRLVRIDTEVFPKFLVLRSR